jgi:Protein of unknown function (DUF1524)
MTTAAGGPAPSRAEGITVKLKLKDDDQLALLALAAVIALGAAGVVVDKVHDAQANNVQQVQAPTATDAAKASVALTKLTVAPKATLTGYSRVKFGPAWADTAVPGVVARNQCDTRSDILRRDLTTVTPATGCKVATGKLTDPYTGKPIDYRAGKTATAVQIDHLVPLAAAWVQGASWWTPELRQQFANDPRNLLAVDGPTNESKGDDTAEDFQPRPEFWCAYGVRTVVVKTAYKLTVDPDEKTELNRMLGTCK